MYTLTYVGGTLTITPATLTITANSTSRQVGAANPAFTASYSGFVAGDGPSAVSGLTLSTLATTNSPAGTYSIVPGGASAMNYKISYVNGALTLTSAPTPTPTPVPVTAVYPTQQTANLTTPATSAPIYSLTIPALEGVVTAGLTPFAKLLPSDLAGQFQADVTSKITDILGNQALSISSASLNVVALALGDIASSYIAQATNRITNCSGIGCGPVEAGAATYVMQVAVNTAIDYITTPPLWATGPVGVTAAVDAAIVQSTATNVVSLTMLLLNW
jgi:hypothetical protein